MQPEGESQVRQLLSADVKLIGVVGPGRVAICRTEQQGDPTPSGLDERIASPVCGVYPCPVAARHQLTTRLGSTPRSAAQLRTLHAALALFTEHGVSATSYQMIADAVGVTKGAIYHQFKTKDEIVIGVSEMELARLEDALEAAEAIPDRMQARELLLNRVIDHAVEHRRAANTLQFDPVLVRVLSDHQPFQSFVQRLYGMLVGDEPGPDTQVRLAALTCVVGGTVAHPLVAGIDDDTLRAQLLDMAGSLIDLPTQSRTRIRRARSANRASA